jgi:hypothetical protein
VPRLCELYPGICFTTEEKARKNLRVAACTTQVITVQYKNNERCNKQKKNSNTEQYDVKCKYWVVVRADFDGLEKNLMSVPGF